MESSMKYDSLIFGNIYTMNQNMPVAGAMGIKEGKIAFVGTRSEGEALRAVSEHIFDTGEYPIFPGFLDTHVHVIPSGILMKGCDVSKAADIAEIQALMKEYAKNVPEGEWIYGTHFQDKRIAEKRLMTKTELDEISTKHPVFLYHNDGHPYAFNSMAMDILGLSPDMPGVLMDDTGEMNGMVVDPACADVGEKAFALLQDSEMVEGFRRLEEYAVQYGITTIFAKEYLFALKAILRQRDTYKTTIKPMMRTPGGCADHRDLDMLLCDEELKKETTVCTFVDGAFDGWSAANFEPYEGQPLNFGMLYNTDEQLYSYLKKAHDSGLQVSCHAIGDYGIEQTLNVYERILKESPREDHRHRIEHFEMPAKYQIRRAARLGCVCGMQPLLLEVCEGMDMEGYRIFIGDRVKRCSPYRSCLDEGILIGGGSDYSVTEMHPLHAIRIAMEHPVKSERISLYEGLAMFTVNAARIGFLENRKGMLKEGLDADFIILDANPYAVKTEKLSDIRVLATISGGRTVCGNTEPFEVREERRKIASADPAECSGQLYGGPAAEYRPACGSENDGKEGESYGR